MSSLTLKLIAMVAMLLDHVAYVFCGSNESLYMTLRAIGRLAFPVYCFLVAEGYKKTSDVFKYMLRLAVAALISEIPFNLCFSKSIVSTGYVNVMFTLLFGLMAVYMTELIFKNTKLIILSAMPTVLFSVLATVLSTDYGAYGVILIVLFYLTGVETTKGKLLSSVCLLWFGARYLLQFAFFNAAKFLTDSFGLAIIESVRQLNKWDYMQLFASAALLLIILYNGNPGFKPTKKIQRKLLQYSLYLYYPIHLTVIWIISLFIK